MKKHFCVRTAVILLISAAAFFSGCSRTQSAAVSVKDTGLVIYSPHNTEMAEFIIKEFRQRTGIKAVLVSGGTGELLSRLDARRDTFQADVFWGGGAESLEACRHLFQPYIPLQQNTFIQGYSSPSHLWNGLSLMPMVIICNTKLVPPNRIPYSWKDLLNPYFMNQVSMGNPETSGSSFSMLCTLLSVFGKDEKGWADIKKLSSILGSSGITAKSEDVYESVAAGETFAGLTFEDAGLTLQKARSPVRLIYPAEGTAIVSDGIALTKNAVHSQDARTFIEFALSRDVQLMVSSRWNRRSIRSDVPPPAGAVPVQSIKTISYSYAAIAQQRNDVIARWHAIRVQTLTDGSGRS